MILSERYWREKKKKIITKKTTGNRVDVASSFNGIKTKGNNIEISVKFNIFIFDSAEVWYYIYPTNSLHNTSCGNLGFRFSHIMDPKVKRSIISLKAISLQRI